MKLSPSLARVSLPDPRTVLQLALLQGCASTPQDKPSDPGGDSTELASSCIAPTQFPEDPSQCDTISAHDGPTGTNPVLYFMVYYWPPNTGTLGATAFMVYVPPGTLSSASLSIDCPACDHEQHPLSLLEDGDATTDQWKVQLRGISTRVPAVPGESTHLVWTADSLGRFDQLLATVVFTLYEKDGGETCHAWGCRTSCYENDCYLGD